MGEGVLERDVLRLFGAGLVGEGVSLIDGLNMMNLLNFRLHEEFILLFVHYFIYYTLTQLSLTRTTLTLNISNKLQGPKLKEYPSSISMLIN